MQATPPLPLFNGPLDSPLLSLEISRVASLAHRRLFETVGSINHPLQPPHLSPSPPPSPDRRTFEAGNRTVNAASVRIQEPAGTNGVSAAEVAEALTNGGKSKKKAYRK